MLNQARMSSSTLPAGDFKVGYFIAVFLSRHLNRPGKISPAWTIIVAQTKGTSCVSRDASVAITATLASLTDRNNAFGGERLRLIGLPTPPHNTLWAPLLG